MDEIRLPELLCDYFNGIDGEVTFIPEVWRENCATIWLIGGGERLREYIDGSYIMGIPFEIRVRCAGRSVSDRLDAVKLFSDISGYIKETSLSSLVDGKVEIMNGASKSAVYENGEEEYRASYRLSWFCEN